MTDESEIAQSIMDALHEIGFSVRLVSLGKYREASSTASAILKDEGGDPIGDLPADPLGAYTEIISASKRARTLMIELKGETAFAVEVKGLLEVWNQQIEILEEWIEPGGRAR